MKADQKIQFENEKGKMEDERYTHFELLVKRVEVLQENLEIVCKILDQNKLTTVKTDYKMPPNFDDEVFIKLEENDED